MVLGTTFFINLTEQEINSKHIKYLNLNLDQLLE